MTIYRVEVCATHAAQYQEGREAITRQDMDTQIMKEIKKIRDTFGLLKGRDSRSVPFARLMKLFNMIEGHIKYSE